MYGSKQRALERKTDPKVTNAMTDRMCKVCGGRHHYSSHKKNKV